MPSNSKAEPSQRQLRVGEQLRQILSELLKRGHFRSEVLMDLGAYVTVTEVRPSPDLRNATAYIVMHDRSNMGAALPALNEEVHFFQKEINRMLKMKFTPRLRFVEDQSYDEANRIESILRNISRKDS
jgi:ribosome-binding factor A